MPTPALVRFAHRCVMVAAPAVWDGLMTMGLRADHLLISELGPTNR
ncbi:hypothetical protein [Nocardia flavorosea]|uniref:Uncharacterized protein n=1 Tax=Nocardia flavorosea TaxID=53429 RepID=A0A846YL47_9NOCA|nr:hypothetical protein [Nocardia flavorosea]NKY59705.1 hypothetical protein [Nocardia flavorosea]